MVGVFGSEGIHVYGEGGEGWVCFVGYGRVRDGVIGVSVRKGERGVGKVDADVSF